MADNADDEDEAEDEVGDGFRERREGARELADVDVRREGERWEGWLRRGRGGRRSRRSRSAESKGKRGKG